MFVAIDEQGQRLFKFVLLTDVDDGFSETFRITSLPISSRIVVGQVDDSGRSETPQYLAFHRAHEYALTEVRCQCDDRA